MSIILNKNVFLIILCSILCGTVCIITNIIYSDKHKYKTEQISLISGYITTSCKYYNSSQCHDLIKWGQNIIEKLVNHK